MLEAVINVSEGRDLDVVAAIADAAGPELLDVHTDPDHHRAVLTVVGEPAVRAVARAAVQRIDLRRHDGVHPRFGAVDVVPFVALAGAEPRDALAARDRFARWAADELELPSFLYGPERTLPTVRREAFDGLVPDHGPSRPHPTAGAVAVGARPPLVAYNVWLADSSIAAARRLARDLRGPAVRALGLAVGDHVQVSMNLIDPATVGPLQVMDLIASQAKVLRAELVGLAPAAVVEAVAPERWAELDLDPERTVEARLARRGVPPPG